MSLIKTHKRQSEGQILTLVISSAFNMKGIAFNPLKYYLKPEGQQEKMIPQGDHLARKNDYIIVMGKKKG